MVKRPIRGALGRSCLMNSGELKTRTRISLRKGTKRKVMQNEVGDEKSSADLVHLKQV